MRMRARLEVGSNGDGAKSAPVKVVANSGGIVDHWYYGPQVHDLAGMRVKSRIPLDWAHDPDNTIGYLNKFDTSSGELVCSGAIVPFAADRGAETLHKLREGVPFEASIEWRAAPEGIEFLDDGDLAVVNDRSVMGPLLIWREWDYVACAVCKFGADSDTSTELAKHKNKTKEIALELSKKEIMDSPETETVEVAAEVAEVTQAEVEAVAVETVEAKTAEVEEVKAVDPDPAVEAVMVATVSTVEAKSDPREEFRTFVATFGTKAADYFAEGKSFDEAMRAHLAHQSQEIESLKQRVAAKDHRGLETPVKFADAEKREKPKGLASVVRIAGQKNK